MKIEKFLVKSFEDKDHTSEVGIVTPEGGKLIGMKVLHDGIYAWYEVPETKVNTKTDYYQIVLKQSIPANAEFICLLDTVVASPQGQAVLIFPIYKLNK